MRYKIVQFFERTPIKRPTPPVDLFMGVLLLQLGHP